MTPPWNDGPAELLRQSLRLLADDTAPSRRLALIASDEALRVTVRAYLDESVRSVDDGWRLVPVIPTRRRVAASESIPDLLELLDDVVAETRRQPPDVAGIERLHRLRLDAFPDGRGGEVSGFAVEVYTALVETLHRHLFDSDLSMADTPRSDRQAAIVAFLRAWATVDDEIRFLVAAETDLLWERRRHPTDFSAMVQALRNEGVVTAQAALGVGRLRDLRWALAHDAQPIEASVLHDATRSTETVLDELRRAVEAAEARADGDETDLEDQDLL